jgi:hypothetical protein
MQVREEFSDLHTRPVKMREERRLRAFENKVLRKILGPDRDFAAGNGENYTVGNFVIFTAHQIPFE